MFSTALSAALVFGIGLCLANAVDVLLLPSQKARLDAMLESATLHLHYQRPLNWILGKTDEGRASAIGLALFTGGVIPLTLGVWAIAAGKTRFDSTWRMLLGLLEFLAFGLVTIGVPLLLYVLAGRWTLRQLRRRGIGVGWLYLLTVAVELPLLGLFFYGAIHWDWPDWTWWAFQVLLGFTVGLPLAGIIWGSVFCFVAEKGLAVVRAMMWRVVANSSGATKGLTVLVTCVLGILRLFTH